MVVAKALAAAINTVMIIVMRPMVLNHHNLMGAAPDLLMAIRMITKVVTACKSHKNQAILIKNHHMGATKDMEPVSLLMALLMMATMNLMGAVRGRMAVSNLTVTQNIKIAIIRLIKAVNRQVME